MSDNKIIEKTKEKLAEIRENFEIESILASAMKLPGVKIDRDQYLRKQLQKYYSEDVISEAVRVNPAKAGIGRDEINKLAKAAIRNESMKVTAISVAASFPSNPAVSVASTTADFTSFFASILRILQKLCYLYGFPEFDLNYDSVDDETMCYVMIFVGVMFGVDEATMALNKIAINIAEKVAQKLPQNVIKKAVMNVAAKSFAKKVGGKITTQLFADIAANCVPVLGSIASGALTFGMFESCCKKLRKKLATYELSNPNHYISGIPSSSIIYLK